MKDVMLVRNSGFWSGHLKVICSLITLSSLVGNVSADEVVDSIMMRSPEFATPRVVRKYPERLLELWSQALQRPEAELRREAALAIIRVRQQGMTGFESVVPMLRKELSRSDQHPTVLLAVTKALVELDARDSAADLYRISSSGNADLTEIIEPALAKWKFPSAREEWLKRIDQTQVFRRPGLRAIQCLASAGETKAVPRLREIVLAPETSTTARLEAARALGVLRTSGGEDDAIRLSNDKTPNGLHARIAAAWILRHHRGNEAIKLLQAFSKDSESTVVSVALTQLIEIDPTLAEPELGSYLKNNDATVRALAVEVLNRRAKLEYVILLSERLSDLHPDVRSKARRSLKELSTKFNSSVITVGTKVLNSNDWRGKEQAAYLLTQLDHKPAVDRLVELLRDDRPEVAVAAGWALRVLAVPATYPKVLQHIKEFYVSGPAPDWRDRQLSQLVQLLGLAKYQPAHDTIKGTVPPAPRTPPSNFIQTRAAGAWAIGLLHENKPDAAIASLLDGRINAIMPNDVEHELVRTMSVISLARMKQVDKLETLRKFFWVKKPSFNLVSNSCGWAIEQLTGEKMPAPGIEEATYMLWFLTPTE